MKILVPFLRFLTGALFIFSGLIKANDPLGFGYKLEEYFVVFKTEFMSPLATGMAIAICVLEVVLGMALWMGWKTRAVIWWLLAMILFFTFLTFYSAWFNKVTECGCFGDFIHLTPWQSFSKDVVLLGMIVLLAINRKSIRPRGPAFLGSFMVGLTAIATMGFAFYTWNNLPYLDFRPYAVGKNLPEGMAIPKDAPIDVYKHTYYYRVDGKIGAYTEIEIEDLKKAYGEKAVLVSRKDELVSKGYKRPIHDFVISDLNGNAYTDDFLQAEHCLLVISPFLDKASGDAWIKVAGALAWARSRDVRIAILTGSGKEAIESFMTQYGASQWPFYQCDATVLKTMMRSNPGLMVLRKGTVTALYPSRTFPDAKALAALTGLQP
ncbi:MAG: DoxX family membrane protein [Sphingomonadales bacterium]|nr:DoxX family membrane protein [Sphingomonadales bacterium]